MVLSSWQSHCESSPGSFDERRMAPSVRRPKLLAFWLETVYSRPFLGSFLGNIFPIWRHPSSWPPKGPSLGGNTSFEPSSVRISATVRPGRMIEKKQYNKKLRKVLYFPYLGGIPGGPIRPLSCMVGDVRDVITCAEFQIEIFMGYDFTGGRIFDFPIDFCMGLTTVQR